MWKPRLSRPRTFERTRPTTTMEVRQGRGVGLNKCSIYTCLLRCRTLSTFIWVTCLLRCRTLSTFIWATCLLRCRTLSSFIWVICLFCCRTLSAFIWVTCLLRYRPTDELIVVEQGHHRSQLFCPIAHDLSVDVVVIPHTQSSSLHFVRHGKPWTDGDRALLPVFVDKRPEQSCAQNECTSLSSAARRRPARSS